MEININIIVEFNVGPPYWMRDWPVYTAGIQRMQRAVKEKQQISPPKKFYLAEHI